MRNRRARRQSSVVVRIPDRTRGGSPLLFARGVSTDKTSAVFTKPRPFSQSPGRFHKTNDLLTRAVSLHRFNAALR
jgi:hypothetical protein